MLGRAVRSQATQPESVRKGEKRERKKEKKSATIIIIPGSRSRFSPPLTSHHHPSLPHVHSAFGGNSQKAKALQNLYFLPTAAPFRDSNESPMNTRPSCGFLSLKVINTLPSPKSARPIPIGPAGRPAGRQNKKLTYLSMPNKSLRCMRRCWSYPRFLQMSDWKNVWKVKCVRFALLFSC